MSLSEKWCFVERVCTEQRSELWEYNFAINIKLGLHFGNGIKKIYNNI